MSIMQLCPNEEMFSIEVESVSLNLNHNFNLPA